MTNSHQRTLHLADEDDDLDPDRAVVSADDGARDGNAAGVDDQDDSRLAHAPGGQDSTKGPQGSDDSNDAQAGDQSATRPRKGLLRVAMIALPLLAMILTGAAGYLKWQDGVVRANEAAGNQAVAATKDIVPAMLSYKPDTVDQDLSAPRERMIGAFKDTFSKLITEVVAPGAKRGKVSAVATVPAAAVVSADERNAVVLAFVDQTITVDAGPPTSTASSVRVSLQKVGQQWFVSDFIPI